MHGTRKPPIGHPGFRPMSADRVGEGGGTVASEAVDRISDALEFSCGDGGIGGDPGVELPVGGAVVARER